MFGMSLSALITVILIGAVSGWIASRIMETKGGLLRNIVIGIIGGFLGSFIFGLLGFNVSNLLGTIISSVVGACALIYVGKLLFK